jgi:hypothetical protein
MSWRELLKNNISNTNDNTDRSDKTPTKHKEETPFVTSVPSVIGDTKLKISCWTCSHLSLDELPGLCKLFPKQKLIPIAIVDKGCKQFKPDLSPLDKQITRLWNHAHNMADFTDSDNAPFEERKALVPAIFSLGQTIDIIKGN